ncbi:MAG: hypothetical protein H6779_02700 [Candidatus Nomurabacteria bacterium]|nr:hypothetical protein [Candidatus Nomurabacteria bacterium]USN87299.1 MAG: hypothetical protein H6779_02700 [Candidatus Nomurabacteria bacterium]
MNKVYIAYIIVIVIIMGLFVVIFNHITLNEVEEHTTNTHDSDFINIDDEKSKPISGLVVFTGTYTIIDYNVPDRDFEYSKSIDENGICHMIEIKEPFGEEVLSIVDRIKRGNGVYSLSETGGVLLNLPWHEIPEKDKAVIQSSVVDPISLQFQKKPVGGHGVGACYSSYEYIGIIE